MRSVHLLFVVQLCADVACATRSTAAKARSMRANKQSFFSTSHLRVDSASKAKHRYLGTLPALLLLSQIAKPPTAFTPALQGSRAQMVHRARAGLGSFNVNGRSITRKRVAGIRATQDSASGVSPRYRNNVAAALQTLPGDFPNILSKQPNWRIYTPGFTSDLRQVGPAALKLLSVMLGISDDDVVVSLSSHKNALQKLQRFRQFVLDWDSIKVKADQYQDTSGEFVIVVRWHADLGLKSLGPFKLPLQGLPGLPGPFEASPREPTGDIVIDATSKFYADVDGKLHRHVVEDVDLKPSLEALDRLLDILPKF